MFTNAQHFQLLKVFCILGVVASARVMLKIIKPSSGITIIQCFVIAMGIWAIASGFLLERRILSRPDKPGHRFGRSTPLSRWRAVNLARVMSATSVALWGLILLENGGATWLSYLYLGVGGLMVLIWRPSSIPQQARNSQSG
jgi:hypothetical protein